MQKILNWKKWSAVITIICFQMTSFSFPPAHAAEALPAVSSQKSLNIDKLKLPVKFGEVVESHAGKGNVIIVQDAHAIPDAQKNIANVIKYVQQEYGVGTVALEGASGDLDPQIFRSFPDKKLLRQVMKGYMDAGEMAGGTAAAIFDETQTKYEGVEDWDIYEEGLGLYLTAMEKEPEILEKLSAQRLKLNAEKEKSYSKELLEIDRVIEKFYEDAAQLTDVIKLLGAIQAPQAGSELDALWKEVNKQSQEPGTKGQSNDIEVRALAGKVEKFLNTQRGQAHMRVREKGLTPLGVFNAKKQEWMTGEISAEAFALYLKETSAKLGFSLEMSEDLSGMVKQQHTLKGIEGTKLFRDLEIYIRDIKQQLIERTTDHVPHQGGQVRATIAERTPQGRAKLSPGVAELVKLDNRTESLRMITKLAKLELPRNEWTELSRGAVSKALSTLGFKKDDLVFHLAFYLNAEERDQIFFENLRGSLHGGQAWGVDRGPTVIVAGGFHAEGITSRLKEAGIGYALVMPKISHIPESIAYRAQMRGEVSWKDYFEVENGRIHLYKAFVRATRDKLIGGDSSGVAESIPRGVAAGETDLQMLKAWRDQIIRDLSDQGRVQRAAFYTRYMDEVVDDALKHTDTDKLMGKVDNFIRGLRGLNKANQLNSEQITALLKANMMPPKEITSAIASNASGSISLRDPDLAVLVPKVDDTMKALSKTRDTSRSDSRAEQLKAQFLGLQEEMQENLNLAWGDKTQDIDMFNAHKKEFRRLVGEANKLAENPANQELINLQKITDDDLKDVNAKLDRKENKLIQIQEAELKTQEEAKSASAAAEATQPSKPVQENKDAGKFAAVSATGLATPFLGFLPQATFSSIENGLESLGSEVVTVAGKVVAGAQYVGWISLSIPIVLSAIVMVASRMVNQAEIKRLNKDSQQIAVVKKFGWQFTASLGMIFTGLGIMIAAAFSLPAAIGAIAVFTAFGLMGVGFSWLFFAGVFYEISMYKIRKSRAKIREANAKQVAVANTKTTLGGTGATGIGQGLQGGRRLPPLNLVMPPQRNPGTAANVDTTSRSEGRFILTIILLSLIGATLYFKDPVKNFFAENKAEIVKYLPKDIGRKADQEPKGAVKTGAGKKDSVTPGRVVESPVAAPGTPAQAPAKAPVKMEGTPEDPAGRALIDKIESTDYLDGKLTLEFMLDQMNSGVSTTHMYRTKVEETAFNKLPLQVKSGEILQTEEQLRNLLLFPNTSTLTAVGRRDVVNYLNVLWARLKSTDERRKENDTKIDELKKRTKLNEKGAPALKPATLKVPGQQGRQELRKPGPSRSETRTKEDKAINEHPNGSYINDVRTQKDALFEKGLKVPAWSLFGLSFGTYPVSRLYKINVETPKGQEKFKNELSRFVSNANAVIDRAAKKQNLNLSTPALSLGDKNLAEQLVGIKGRISQISGALSLNVSHRPGIDASTGEGSKRSEAREKLTQFLEVMKSFVQPNAQNIVAASTSLIGAVILSIYAGSGPLGVPLFGILFLFGQSFNFVIDKWEERNIRIGNRLIGRVKDPSDIDRIQKEIRASSENKELHELFNIQKRTPEQQDDFDVLSQYIDSAINALHKQAIRVTKNLETDELKKYILDDEIRKEAESPTPYYGLDTWEIIVSKSVVGQMLVRKMNPIYEFRDRYRSSLNDVSWFVDAWRNPPRFKNVHAFAAAAKQATEKALKDGRKYQEELEKKISNSPETAAEPTNEWYAVEAAIDRLNFDASVSVFNVHFEAQAQLNTSGEPISKADMKFLLKMQNEALSHAEVYKAKYQAELSDLKNKFKSELSNSAYYEAMGPVRGRIYEIERLLNSIDSEIIALNEKNLDSLQDGTTKNQTAVVGPQLEAAQKAELVSSLETALQNVREDVDAMWQNPSQETIKNARALLNNLQDKITAAKAAGVSEQQLKEYTDYVAEMDGYLNSLNTQIVEKEILQVAPTGEEVSLAALEENYSASVGKFNMFKHHMELELAPEFSGLETFKKGVEAAKETMREAGHAYWAELNKEYSGLASDSDRAIEIAEQMWEVHDYLIELDYSASWAVLEKAYSNALQNGESMTEAGRVVKELRNNFLNAAEAYKVVLESLKDQPTKQRIALVEAGKTHAEAGYKSWMKEYEKRKAPVLEVNKPDPLFTLGTEANIKLLREYVMKDISEPFIKYESDLWTPSTILALLFSRSPEITYNNGEESVEVKKDSIKSILLNDGNLKKALEDLAATVNKPDPSFVLGSQENRELLDQYRRANHDTANDAVWTWTAQNILDALLENAESTLKNKGQSEEGKLAVGVNRAEPLHTISIFASNNPNDYVYANIGERGKTPSVAEQSAHFKRTGLLEALAVELNKETALSDSGVAGPVALAPAAQPNTQASDQLDGAASPAGESVSPQDEMEKELMAREAAPGELKPVVAEQPGVDNFSKTALSQREQISFDLEGERAVESLQKYADAQTSNGEVFSWNASRVLEAIEATGGKKLFSFIDQDAGKPIYINTDAVIHKGTSVDVALNVLVDKLNADLRERNKSKRGRIKLGSEGKIEQTPTIGVKDPVNQAIAALDGAIAADDVNEFEKFMNAYATAVLAIDRNNYIDANGGIKFSDAAARLKLLDDKYSEVIGTELYRAIWATSSETEGVPQARMAPADPVSESEFLQPLDFPRTSLGETGIKQLELAIEALSAAHVSVLSFALVKKTGDVDKQKKYQRDYTSSMGEYKKAREGIVPSDSEQSLTGDERERILQLNKLIAAYRTDYVRLNPQGLLSVIEGAPVAAPAVIQPPVSTANTSEGINLNADDIVEVLVRSVSKDRNPNALWTEQEVFDLIYSINMGRKILFWDAEGSIFLNHNLIEGKAMREYRGLFPVLTNLAAKLNAHTNSTAVKSISAPTLTEEVATQASPSTATEDQASPEDAVILEKIQPMFDYIELAHAALAATSLEELNAFEKEIAVKNAEISSGDGTAYATDLASKKLAEVGALYNKLELHKKELEEIENAPSITLDGRGSVKFLRSSRDAEGNLVASVSIDSVQSEIKFKPVADSTTVWVSQDALPPIYIKTFDADAAAEDEKKIALDNGAIVNDYDYLHHKGKAALENALLVSKELQTNFDGFEPVVGEVMIRMGQAAQKALIVQGEPGAEALTNEIVSSLSAEQRVAIFKSVERLLNQAADPKNGGIIFNDIDFRNIVIAFKDGRDALPTVRIIDLTTANYRDLEKQKNRRDIGGEGIVGKNFLKYFRDKGLKEENRDAFLRLWQSIELGVLYNKLVAEVQDSAPNLLDGVNTAFYTEAAALAGLTAAEYEKRFSSSEKVENTSEEVEKFLNSKNETVVTGETRAVPDNQARSLEAATGLGNMIEAAAEKAAKEAAAKAPSKQASDVASVQVPTAAVPSLGEQATITNTTIESTKFFPVVAKLINNGEVITPQMLNDAAKEFVGDNAGTGTVTVSLPPTLKVGGLESITFVINEELIEAKSGDSESAARQAKFADQLNFTRNRTQTLLKNLAAGDVMNVSRNALTLTIPALADIETTESGTFTYADTKYDFSITLSGEYNVTLARSESRNLAVELGFDPRQTQPYEIWRSGERAAIDPSVVATNVEEFKKFETESAYVRRQTPNGEPFLGAILRGLVNRLTGEVSSLESLSSGQLAKITDFPEQERHKYHRIEVGFNVNTGQIVIFQIKEDDNGAYSITKGPSDSTILDIAYISDVLAASLDAFNERQTSEGDLAAQTDRSETRSADDALEEIVNIKKNYLEAIGNKSDEGTSKAVLNALDKLYMDLWKVKPVEVQQKLRSDHPALFAADRFLARMKAYPNNLVAALALYQLDMLEKPLMETTKTSDPIRGSIINLRLKLEAALSESKGRSLNALADATESFLIRNQANPNNPVAVLALYELDILGKAHIKKIEEQGGQALVDPVWTTISQLKIKLEGALQQSKREGKSLTSANKAFADATEGFLGQLQLNRNNYAAVLALYELDILGKDHINKQGAQAMGDPVWTKINKLKIELEGDLQQSTKGGKILMRDNSNALDNALIFIKNPKLAQEKPSLTARSETRGENAQSEETKKSPAGLAEAAEEVAPVVIKVFERKISLADGTERVVTYFQVTGEDRQAAITALQEALQDAAQDQNESQVTGAGKAWQRKAFLGAISNSLSQSEGSIVFGVALAPNAIGSEITEFANKIVKVLSSSGLSGRIAIDMSNSALARVLRAQLKDTEFRTSSLDSETIDTAESIPTAVEQGAELTDNLVKNLMQFIIDPNGADPVTIEMAEWLQIALTVHAARLSAEYKGRPEELRKALIQSLTLGQLNLPAEVSKNINDLLQIEGGRFVIKATALSAIITDIRSAEQAAVSA